MSKQKPTTAALRVAGLKIAEQNGLPVRRNVLQMRKQAVENVGQFMRDNRLSNPIF